LPWVSSKNPIKIPENSISILTNTTTDINVFIDRHNVSQYFSVNTLKFLKESTNDNFDNKKSVNELQSYAIDKICDTTDKKLQSDITTPKKRKVEKFKKDNKKPQPKKQKVENLKTKQEDKSSLSEDEKASKKEKVEKSKKDNNNPQSKKRKVEKFKKDNKKPQPKKQKGRKP